MSLPLGFRYAATYAGIRKVAKDDLALIVSDTLASAAAVFTKNRVVMPRCLQVVQKFCDGLRGTGCAPW